MTYDRLMFKRLRIGLNDFANSFLETLQPYKAKNVFIGFVIFIMVFAAFASLSTEAISNGDAAIYLQQMKNLNFTERPVHLGYYLLGAGFIRLLPGSDDYAINLMSCFLGALCVALVYFITFAICHKHTLAVIASLLLFTHNLFLENSIYAEVYIPQVCFLLMSVLLWLFNKPVLASLSFLLSFLITPSTILALPCFIILRPRLRPFLLFCSIFAISAAVAVFPVHQSYFFGSRGVFNVANRPLDINWVLAKEGREILFGFFHCIPLVVVGLLEIFSRKQFRPFAFALLILWLVTLFLAEKIPDVSPQLPAYTLLCVVGGLGLGLILRVLKNKACSKSTIYAAMIVVILAVFMNGLDAFKEIRALNKCRTGYRNTVLRINKIADPGYLVIGYWSIGILFEHYLFQQSFTPLWINTEWLDGTSGSEQQDKYIQKYNQAVAERRQIWIFGNYFEPMANLQRDGYTIAKFDSVQFAPDGPVIPIYVASAKK